MNRAWNNFVFLLLIFSLTLIGAARTADTKKSAKNEKAPEFVLKDQFGNEQTLKFPREKPIILVFADQDGAKDSEKWITPLIAKYSAKIEFQGVAELSGVPGIAKGYVRNLLKKKSEQPILLDWSGEVSRSYKFSKDKANLVIVDKQGDVVARQSGEPNAAELSKLHALFDDFIK